MTYAIAGVSGNTGKVVAETLVARGANVRVIVRDEARGAPWRQRGAEIAVADLGDEKALTRALDGTEGAYLLVPPNYGAADFRAYQRAISRALAGAVAASGVPHVVLLSSIGAQHASGTGPIAGLAEAERLLADTAPKAVVTNLRAGYFYANLAGSALAAKETGAFPSFFPPDFAFPMVSTNDIGRLAAARLLEGTPSEGQILELGTSRTTAEIVRALGARLGKEITVNVAPRSAFVPALKGAGLTDSLAELYAEMTVALLNGHVAFDGRGRRLESTEPLERVVEALLGDA